MNQPIADEYIKILHQLGKTFNTSDAHDPNHILDYVMP